MRLRSFFGVFGLALLLLLRPSPVTAERLSFSGVSYPTYQVDAAIWACNQKLKRWQYSVLAYSPAQAFMCIYGDAGLNSESRKLALEGCESNQSPAERRLSKCRIVFEAGKIVDAKFYKTQKRDARSPVSIEIYDGKTGKTSTTSGILSSGQLLSERSVEVKLVTSAGKTICEGKTMHSDTGARFEAVCFGKYKFKGKVPEPSGYAMDEGQIIQLLTVKVTHEKSYILVTPR